jgi:D-arabinose 1-dehydrogenase-like Zn-dependent alcohol dehydrogenase
MPLAGAMSDRFNRRGLYAVAAAAGAIWPFVFFPLINDGGSRVILTVGVVVGLVGSRFDIVGVTPTIKAAQASMAQGGRLTVVGIAGGVIEWDFFTTPYESTLTNTYWGTIEDLHDVTAMYRAGQIHPEIERFTMDGALDAYRKLEAGEVNGRAVVTPNA